MEYIAGKPLTDYCIAENLTLEERLRLFLKICAAVQFAHQNLVVHRDLKPGNILITEDCEPKLLDFGIAKLLTPDDDTFGVTLAEHQRLTPGYASPEQVRGEPVTTVSDIYTLGTLLYEILTGQKAHRFSTPRPPATELLRVVAQEEPLRPSTAALDPATKRRLRGDLDTIILKALRKEPARRYAGMGSFAEDIRRYLENRPVTARRDSLAYRTSKFVQRNKLGVVAAALVFLTLLAGIVATTRQMQLARKERARAERRFNEVRGIANSLMLELHDAIKNLPGAMAARQLITQRALEYLDSLEEESGSDLSLKSELATAYGKIGLVTFDVAQAIKSHRKATALSEELLQRNPKNAAYRKQLSQSYRNLSDVLKISGNSTGAIEYARKSLAVMQAFATDHPGDNQGQLDLADGHLVLGQVLLDAGNFKSALENILTAMNIQQNLVAQSPRDREMRRDLGGIYGTASNAYEESGDYPAALEYGRKSTAIAQEFFQAEPLSVRARRDLWASIYRCGRQLGLTGDWNGALENATQAIGLIEGLASADPTDKGHRRWLALNYLSEGEALAKLGRGPEAMERYQKAVAISEELFRDDPGRVEAQRDLMRMYEAIGLLFVQLGQTDGALQNLNRAHTLAETCAARDSVNGRVQNRFAGICQETGDLYWKLFKQPAAVSPDRGANLRAARSSYQRSLELWTELKKNGMLNNVDAATLDKLPQKLTQCDEALAKL
jgi:eukaryotic-like serine/threonine-protein kinase